MWNIIELADSGLPDAAEDALESLSDMGDFDQKPTPTNDPDPDPTTDPDPTYPTLLPGVSGAPYCFRDHNDKGRWDSFTAEEADAVSSQLCASAEELSPQNSFGYVTRSMSGLRASILWAENQRDCSFKKAMPIADICIAALVWIGKECDDLDPETIYGGGFIEDQGYGCVEWFIGLDTTEDVKLLSIEAPPKSGDHISTSTAKPLETGLP